MQSRVRVSGRIISELSEKIPSNIIALNELIKNAYDAGASLVSITLDSKSKQLVITDDGSGMDKNDIDTLFHISNSEKKYGELNEYNRYTQGSKGLGFLSVFKFGGNVTWNTKKESYGGLTFSVVYEELLKSIDISEFDVAISDNDSCSKGTSIIIQLTDYSLGALTKYLSIKKNYKKIINSFGESEDDKFIIELIVNGTKYSSESTKSLLSNSKHEQLFNVKYDSKDEVIEFYHNGHKAKSLNYPFDSTRYTLSLNLLIFNLRPHGKANIDQLFFSPQDDLTPLIYVNNNLFNNYSLFDPNIMKNIKTTSVLNQMIGYVKITSSDPLITFNSDRSQFQQNELTDSISDFLTGLNKKIQETGSQNKKYVMEMDILTTNKLPPECNDIEDSNEFKKYIKRDFSFRNDVEIKKENGNVKFSIFNRTQLLRIEPATTPATGSYPAEGSSNGAPSNGSGKEPVTLPPNSPPNQPQPPQQPLDGQGGNTQPPIDDPTPTIPAILTLICSEHKEAIPSQQIDLRQFINSAQDSAGGSINVQKITISADGEEVESGILPSVDKPCEVAIEFRYDDPITGLVISKMTCTFYQPSASVVGKPTKPKLITIPAQHSYTPNYNPHVGNLISQINSLDTKLYLEIIACSVRSLFELSVDSIIRSPKATILAGAPSGLESQVIQIVQHVKGDKNLQSKIANSTTIGYPNLKNRLDPDDFKKAVEKAHLGAHKSGAYISENDLAHLGMLAGFFVVLVNEILN